MCFDPDSRPPIAPMAGAAIDFERLELTSADGATFSAFLASAPAPRGAGMLVLPDVRGLHPYYEELALRFAEAGIDATAVDYFGRTAGLVSGRGADFDHAPHVPRTRFASLTDDVRAAAAALRLRRPAVRALFSIGFCFGGRLAFVTATDATLGLAGAVGFYGWPVGPGRSDVPAPADVAAEMRAPVLGIFGGADPGIPAEAVETFRSALADAGAEHEILVYPDAPHAFFDRKASEFADDSEDAWRRVLDFVAARLG